MRVAALAFGVFAGLVASLILALGGLDVPPEIAADASRQAQAIRFGLFVIGNLGVFGAALTLAAPLGGAILFVAAALLWIVAALLLQHGTDLVLVTPPVLLLFAALPAFIAHFRHPDEPEDDYPEFDIAPPRRPVRRPPVMRAAEEDDEPPEIVLPAYAPEPEPEPEPRLAVNFAPPLEPEWNPRRRRPPPPSARAAFRPVEPDYDEDDEEPSGVARFALGASSVLSFGLYAGLALAALLAVWALRDIGRPPPANAVADSAAAVAALPPPPPAVSEPRPLAPVLTAAPQAPVLAAPEPTAAAPGPQEEFDFGDVVMSSDPLAPPRLSGPASSDAAPAPEPEPAATEEQALVPSVALPGRPVPHPLPPTLANR